jgi:hypothetical protein
MTDLAEMSHDELRAAYLVLGVAYLAMEAELNATAQRERLTWR